AGLVLAAAAAQTAGAGRRPTARAGSALLVAAPLVALAAVLADVRLSTLPAPAWPVLAGLALVVGALALLVDRRLDRLPGRSVRESGSLTSQAVGAVVSLDSRELGRVLTDGGTPARRRRWTRFRTARGPATALVTADLVVLRRSPRHLLQLAVTAAVPPLVALVPQLSGTAGTVLALVGAGLLATSATGEGARRAEMAPVLDRLLPLAAGRVRALRLVVPALVLLPWALVAFGGLGLVLGDPGPWLLLGAATTPVWAAAAVRGAYRPSPDWGGALVATPAGALPTGVASVVARGPDVVLVGLLPVLVTLLLGTVHPAAVAVQLGLGAVALRVAASTATGTLVERLERLSGAPAGDGPGGTAPPAGPVRPPGSGGPAGAGGRPPAGGPARVAGTAP
uniref:DUF6297 family protein n=1 Tax=Cellulomonas endophytica TaxID=2494735 RepID=UPI0013E92F2A